jgi:hypothetical protein
MNTTLLIFSYPEVIRGKYVNGGIQNFSDVSAKEITNFLGYEDIDLRIMELRLSICTGKKIVFN